LIVPIEVIKQCIIVYEKRDYNWALFLGHLVIEKLLKAYFVKHIDTQPPFIHNLLRLAEKTDVKLTEQQKNFLVTVTAFYIRARYDDYKLAFYKTCAKEYTETWIRNENEITYRFESRFILSDYVAKRQEYSSMPTFSRLIRQAAQLSKTGNLFNSRSLSIAQKFCCCPDYSI
jgi:HEPN domain-containing protein